MTEHIREIAFDTETTGLNWSGDDRIVELGAVELLNHIPTGKTFRMLVNPGRSVSADTVRITGITDDMLKDAPAFEHPSIVDALLDFIGDAIIVAHNAKFDRGFLNMELERAGRAPIPEERWIDTVQIARTKFPGAPASLDALCKRFDVSLDGRTYHGALLDSQLLADVYLELIGGRVRAFSFDDPAKTSTLANRKPAKIRENQLAPLLTPTENDNHIAMVERLGSEALWRKYNLS